MPFDPSNDYSDFDNVGSGESGTVEGLIDIEGSASAFRYQKTIIVSVFIDVGFGVSYKDVKGTWKVRILEDGTRNPDGSYAGAVLFEQEVEWTARVVIENLGVAFVSWQPLGDAGSGKSKTSICNGEACAVVSDINDAAQMDAYGATGAWRFIDSSLVRPDETPRQKYDAEKGFSIFTSEGAATIGSYQFFATYQSQNFLTDFPEGAIFETVFDHWQVATLDEEADYLFSYKAGEALYDAVADGWSGQKWWFYKGAGAMRCARTRVSDESYSVSEEDPVVLVGAFGTLRAVQLGHSLLVLHQKGDGVGLRYSRSDGEGWEGYETMIPNVKQIDVVKDENGDLLVVGTAKIAMDGAPAGALVRVVVSRTDETAADGTPILYKIKEINQIVSSGDTDLPAKPKGRLTRTGTTLEWFIQTGDDVQVWRSTDEARSFALAPAPG